MKVSELITELQKLDQDAVVVDRNNDPLYSVHTDVGYWDGRYSELKIDETRKPYYSIVGMTVGISNGLKAICWFSSMEEVLENNRDASITYEDGEVPTYVNEYRTELDNYNWKHLTEPLKVFGDKCQNRLLIQYNEDSEYKVFFERFKSTVTAWRDQDRRCYQAWYPELRALVCYDLTHEQIEAARIAATNFDIEPGRFIVSRVEKDS